MKINFIKANSLSAIKNSTSVLVLSEEGFKKSKVKEVKLAKDKFGFAGKSSQIHQISDIIVVGIGKEKEINDVILQKLGATITAFLNGSKIKDATIFYDAKSLANLAFGALLGSYRFNKYFNEKKKGKDLNVKSLSFGASDVSKAKKEFLELEIIANNVFFARDLVSEPANILNPESYADICKKLAKEGLKIEVLEESDMKKLGMGALLGVGQGSKMKSKLVVMKWNGSKSKDKPLAFVGKGVTFDTGGISIKPSQNMEDMKSDMGGSAVVVGLMRCLAQRKAKVNAVGVVGLVENMPSSTAQRPGDVVTTMSGQTVEVINTDAEGRLVLADALHYTNTKFKPKFIIDLATLTGAVIVSLADVYAGLFSNDDKLTKEIEESGEKTNERVWRLPIGKEYDEMINSDIADMKNVGSGRGAGSTTAAQFLKRFVGDTKWVHLDIAGVAWRGKGDAMAAKGATGYGVRLLNDLVQKYEK